MSTQTKPKFTPVTSADQIVVGGHYTFWPETLGDTAHYVVTGRTRDPDGFEHVTWYIAGGASGESDDRIRDFWLENHEAEGARDGETLWRIS